MSVSRFFVDELIDGLLVLSEPRRRACLYALESRMCLQEVADLTWAGMIRMDLDLTPLMRDIMSDQVRHIRLPYIFWEYASPTIATPLLKLQDSIEHAFGMAYGELQMGYGSMVIIDRKADADHFLGLITEIREGKLG